jgi:hypothetical protein
MTVSATLKHPDSYHPHRTIRNSLSLLAVLAMTATAPASFGAVGAPALVQDLVTQASPSDSPERKAARKPSAYETRLMLADFKEAEAAQQLMPYILALHIDGRTEDGLMVRLNVPVKFTGPVADRAASGMFPNDSDQMGKAKMLRLYEQLESIFSEELDKMSQNFHSTTFYQPHREKAHLCEAGSDEVCTALNEALQTALQRAQTGSPYTLQIVQQWVNFYGFFAPEPSRKPFAQ